MRRYYIYLFLGLLIFFVFGQNILGQQTSENDSISYCDLLRNSKKYDGKVVTVRATYRYGFEWQEIYCLNCRNLGKTWLEIGFDLPSKSEKILKKFPKDAGTINALFTGTFESSNGPFGDGGYRFRFVLKEVTQANLVTKSSADPVKLPDEIRKKVCGGSVESSEKSNDSDCSF